MSSQPTRKRSLASSRGPANPPAPRRAVRQASEDNHARRRLEVLEATWRCILRVGLEQVTIREIASELNATTGTVVHYFRSKDEILMYALDHLISGVVAEVDRRVEGVSGLARLEQILFASLPMDDESLLEWQIWLAFLKASVGNAELSADHARRYAYLRKRLCDEIAALQKQGLVRRGIDVPLEADALIALTDGIGVGRVIDPTRFAPAQQRQLVQRHLAAYLATPAR